MPLFLFYQKNRARKNWLIHTIQRPRIKTIKKNPHHFINAVFDEKKVRYLETIWYVKSFNNFGSDIARA
jgi:hypothetical protein